MIFGDTPVKPSRPGPGLFRAAMGLVIAVPGLLLTAATAQTTTVEARLAAILERAADYCRKLDNAALDFVCLEEVTETSYNLTPDTDVYLYDYQFIRKAGGARERRDLVAVNGKKADSRDAALRTGHFRYENVLFGPIGLLSRYWQTSLAYRIVGDDRLYDRKAVIIEATPNASLVEPHPYGRIWINEKDGSVLKIVWDQRSLGNFKQAEEWAKAHEAEPMFTAYSEYGFEKNGLRFPSRSYTEQAYMRKDRGKSPSAEISVTYKDYKFFTVETETIY
jgi:hypothetical protein